MTLGQHITQLRTARGMSQEALAEALGVTRQSVSKWETDASTPELEKLMGLARLFAISLDELVTGAPFAPAEPPPPQVVMVERKWQTRQIVGILFLVVAAVCLVTMSVLTVLVTPPCLVIGITCLVAQKHPALWSGWAVGALVDGYLRYATGLNWRVIRNTPIWTPELNYMRLAIAWMQFLVMLALVLCTLWALRKEPLGQGSGRRLLTAVAVVGALAVAIRIFGSYFLNFNYLMRLLTYPLDWCAMAVTVWAVRYWRERKREP